MHLALIATNTHALAKAHLARLQSFPSSSTSPILLEASKTVHTAEGELRERVHDMRDAFASLTKRFTGTEKQVQRPSPFSGPEVDSIKDRLTKLEDVTATFNMSKNQYLVGQDVTARLDNGVDPNRPISAFQPRQAVVPYPGLPNSAPPDFPPEPMSVDHLTPLPTGDVSMEGDEPRTEIEGKRYRARQLLKDVLERMEKVEEDKRAMMDRCDDLENILWENIDQDMPQMSWERLEASRIETRDLPPRKRSRRGRRGAQKQQQRQLIQQSSAETGHSATDGEVPEEGEEAVEEIEAVQQAGTSREEAIEVEDGEVEDWDVLETTRDPTGALRGVAGQRVEPSKFTLEEPIVKQEEVDTLRNKVSKLETELKSFWEHQKEREGKIVQACVGVMSGLIEAYVKAVSTCSPSKWADMQRLMYRSSTR